MLIIENRVPRNNGHKPTNVLESVQEEQKKKRVVSIRFT